MIDYLEGIMCGFALGIVAYGYIVRGK